METELAMEVAETITAEDTARSLYVVYRLLPPDAKRVFKELLDKETGGEYNNLMWLPLSEPALNALRDAPEEEYWDELYAKQHGND